MTSDVAVIAGYALRESMRRKVFLIVLLLSIAFLALYGIGVWRAFRDTAGFVPPDQLGLDPTVVTGATVLGLAMFATLFLGTVLAIGFAARMTDPVRHAAARLVGQASLGSRPYRRLSARVSRAVDHRELPCRPGRRAVPRLPRCHDRPHQTPRPPAPDGPGGGPFREHVAEWAGARPGSLLLSLGEYHRTGDISPVRGFKSPLGHPQWWYITLFRAPLEHADGPADACGLPTALTGPVSRRGRQP